MKKKAYRIEVFYRYDEDTYKSVTRIEEWSKAEEYFNTLRKHENTEGVLVVRMSRIQDGLPFFIKEFYANEYDS